MQGLASACRSCLVNKCGLISMDSLIDKTVKIVDCFQIHLNVSLSKHGELPYEICVECLEKLLKARELHLNVLKSEKYLQKKLSEALDKGSIESHSIEPGNSCEADNGASSIGVFNGSPPAGPAKSITSPTNFEAFEDGGLVESIKTEILDDEFLKSDDSSSEYDEGDDKVTTAGNENSTFADATDIHQSTSDQNHPSNSPDAAIAQSESSSSHGPKAKRKRQCRGTYSSYTREQKELFITLYQNGQSIKEAAISANINNSTARGILRSYAKNQCNIVEQSRGGCRQKKLTDEVLEKIKECVQGNTRITLKEIRQKLLEQNINIGKSSINIGLRKLHLNLRPPSFRSIFSKIAAMKQEKMQYTPL